MFVTTWRSPLHVCAKITLEGRNESWLVYAVRMPSTRGRVYWRLLSNQSSLRPWNPPPQYRCTLLLILDCHICEDLWVDLCPDPKYALFPRLPHVTHIFDHSLRTLAYPPASRIQLEALDCFPPPLSLCPEPIPHASLFTISGPFFQPHLCTTFWATIELRSQNLRTRSMFNRSRSWHS